MDRKQTATRLLLGLIFLVLQSLKGRLTAFQSAVYLQWCLKLWFETSGISVLCLIPCGGPVGKLVPTESVHLLQPLFWQLTKHFTNISCDIELGLFLDLDQPSIVSQASEAYCTVCGLQKRQNIVKEVQVISLILYSFMWLTWLVIYWLTFLFKKNYLPFIMEPHVHVLMKVTLYCQRFVDLCAYVLVKHPIINIFSHFAVIIISTPL